MYLAGPARQHFFSSRHVLYSQLHAVSFCSTLQPREELLRASVLRLL